jgi:cobalt-zinc-cadmium efflux system protein
MTDNHSHSHVENKDFSKKSIRLAFYLNLGFAIFEIFGGLFTNSLSIISNALHDFGDSFALGLAWYFSKLSEKKQTLTFSYGFKRFSLLAALVNGLILVAGSLFIFSRAIPRIIHPEVINAHGILFFAIFGITINGIAAWRVRKGKTLNEQMVTWHLFEDVLGWAAVLIVGIISLIKNIYILDPILSMLISLYILWNVIKNLQKTLLLFLQGVPASVKIEMIEKVIAKIPNIKGIHDTHIWSLDGEHHILTTHIVFAKQAPDKDIFDTKCTVKHELEKFGIQHATIETEIEGESCPLK